jgi:hypothetical protein
MVYALWGVSSDITTVDRSCFVRTVMATQERDIAI